MIINIDMCMNFCNCIHGVEMITYVVQKMIDPLFELISCLMLSNVLFVYLYSYWRLIFFSSGLVVNFSIILIMMLSLARFQQTIKQSL
jgi:hypothetical protein